MAEQQLRNISKNGRDYKGDQKYRCNAYGTLDAQKGYSDLIKQLAYGSAATCQRL